jgi:hypothetical protein
MTKEPYIISFSSIIWHEINNKMISSSFKEGELNGRIASRPWTG